MAPVEVCAKPVEAAQRLGLADGGGCVVVDDRFGFTAEGAAVLDLDQDLFVFDEKGLKRDRDNWHGDEQKHRGK